MLKMKTYKVTLEEIRKVQEMTKYYFNLVPIKTEIDGKKLNSSDTLALSYLQASIVALKSLTSHEIFDSIKVEFDDFIKESIEGVNG